MMETLRSKRRPKRGPNRHIAEVCKIGRGRHAKKIYFFDIFSYLLLQAEERKSGEAEVAEI